MSAVTAHILADHLARTPVSDYLSSLSSSKILWTPQRPELGVRINLETDIISHDFVLPNSAEREVLRLALLDSVEIVSNGRFVE